MKQDQLKELEKPEPVPRNGETVGQVVEILKKQILDGRLVPGQRLISRDLVEQLNISRGPLREAFRQLAAERLIDVIPNRGAIVRRMDVQDIENLYQIREALEGLAVRLAAKKIDEGDNRAFFTAVLERGRRHNEHPVFANFVVDNREFHQAIVHLSGNPQLGELIDKYQQPVFMIHLRQVISNDQIIKNSLAEHEAIAAGILAGDPDAACRAMEAHLRHTASLIVNLREQQKN